MSIHAIGIAGLVTIFVIGTLRPINLGVLAMVMTFVLGTFVVRETPREMYTGFPVDLFVLLTGVTYLFGIAARNGTVEWIVDESFGAARRRRTLIPWVVFGLAAPAYRAACGNHEDNARLARDAGVRTLVLTHLLPQIDQPGVREQIVHEIQRVFDGRVIWGQDLMRLEIGQRGVAAIEKRD